MHRKFRFITSIGCVNIKVASFQIGNLNLLSYLAKQDWIENLWISTGMATHDEIVNALSIFNRASSSGPNSVTFFHCVSQYPIEKISDYQLNNIHYLRDLSGKAAGFSDHTLGINAARIATAMGAAFIEKHFTIDNNLAGADHSMSANPSVFSELVSALRSAWI